MNEKQVENPVYSHDTLEFVTVAVEFCAFLENSQGREKKDFVETLLKLLPLLYLKAVLLPRVESNGDFLPPDRITEQEYDFIRHIIFDILRKDDEYEELVCDQDMQTDVSQWKSISENLADMYQAIRNSPSDPTRLSITAAARFLNYNFPCFKNQDSSPCLLSYNSSGFLASRKSFPAALKLFP